MQKYIIRSVKYLVYFLFIFFIIVGLIFLIESIQTPGIAFTDIFEEGSMPKLVVFFIAIAAFYPALGFTKREFHLNGDFAQYEDIVKESAKSLEFVIDSEDDETLIIRQEKGFRRLNRMYEDKVTFHKKNSPVIIEGYRKDVQRILNLASWKIRQNETTEEENR